MLRLRLNLGKCLEMQLVAGDSLSLQQAAEGVHSMLHCCGPNFLRFWLEAAGGDKEVVVVSCLLQIFMLHLYSN